MSGGVRSREMLSPISKGARESLYRDVESLVSRYGNLTLYERAFTLRLIVHKLEESFYDGDGGR